MTTPANLSPLPQWREFTALGVVAPGAKLYSFLSNSSTPWPVFTDATQGIARTNPVEADAGGLLPSIWLQVGISYRLRLDDASGNVLWGPVDEITAASPYAVNVDITGTAGEDLAAGKVAYASDGSGGKVAGRWYLADADNGYSANAPAIAMVPTAIASGASGTLRLEGRMTGLSGLSTGSWYYVSGTAGSLTATQGKNRRLVGFADSTTTLVLVPRTRNSAPPMPCNVLDFGAVADGTTDNTAAFQAAVDAATLADHAEVHIPAGVYLLEGEVTIHEGIPIIGVGGQGSNYTSATTIVHDSDGDLFTCDGNGASQMGTGGAFKNLLIVKQDGRSGGAAINIVATDDNHRPGEMQLENILIYGIGTGVWEFGIVIDGSACTTPGSRGVRSVQFSKVRVSDVSTANKYIYILAGVHITGTHVQVDSGHGGTVGMTIEGFSENVCFADMIINGAVVIGTTVGDLFHCAFHGRVTTFTQGNSDAVGVAAISCGSFTNNSRFFRFQTSNNPAFLARRTTEAADVTGDGTEYIVKYDSEQFDINSNFDITTGRFTAPVRGPYTFQAAVALNDCGNAHTRYDINFLHRDDGGVGLFYYDFAIGNPSTDFANVPGMAATGGNVTMAGSITVEMEANETMEVAVTVAGGAKTVDIFGANATVIYTYFAGHYVGA